MIRSGSSSSSRSAATRRSLPEPLAQRIQGEREDRDRLAADVRHRHVVAEHRPEARVRQGRDRHRLGVETPRGRPRAAAVPRRREHCVDAVAGLRGARLRLRVRHHREPAGGVRVHAEPRDERLLIRSLVDERHALGRRPREPVPRVRDDDVVVGAVLAEAAVAPDDVDRPARVGRGARQRRRTDAAHVLGQHPRHRDRRAERAPAVGRPHGLDLVRRRVGVVRAAGGQVEDDDEGSVRLHHGLRAVLEAEVAVGNAHRRRRPREPTVRRQPRPDRGRAHVEVREVAVAAERAQRPVVARDPLLVVVLGRVSGGHHRRAPRDAVAGPAAQGAHADLGLRDGADQPGAVLRVVGDDGVARRGRVSCRPRLSREGGEEAGAPVRACVLRGREADARGPAVDHPAGLEGGHERRADGEARRLHLGLVLPVLVGERVTREPPAHGLAARADRVLEVGDGEVAARAAADRVARAVVGGGEPVVARAADEEVAAGAAVQQVGGAAALERVRAGAAEDDVRGGRPDETVGPERAADRRRARGAHGHERSRGGEDEDAPGHWRDRTPIGPGGRVVSPPPNGKTAAKGTEEDDDGEGSRPERRGRPAVRGSAPPGREQGEGGADRERGQPQVDRPQGRQGRPLRGPLEGGPAEEGPSGRDRGPLEDEQAGARQRTAEPLTRYLYGAAHEQFPPDDLLRQAVEAEDAGFDGVACSDHFQPWWEPGESGMAWVWLGAVGQATKRGSIGTAVTPALSRYHPALVAQAWATLEVMFPGRTFLGIGSGESLNESPFGADWPPPAVQLVAMEEALGLIRRLFAGERVTQGGRFKTKEAYLHTRPERPPPIYVSAFYKGAAQIAARFGDGLWTLGDPESAPELIDEYKGACSDAGKEPGEVILQAQFSWASDDEAAREGARGWKGAQPGEVYTAGWHG